MKKAYAGSLLALLLCFIWLVPSPVNADARVLEWATIDKPGDNGNLVVTPSEVSEIAVAADNVVYAIDTANSKFYRSLDGGTTWVDMTLYLVEAGAVLPANHIAAAPDKPGIVAVVTDGGSKVYLSNDGGTEWTDTSVPSLVVGGIPTTIQTIAISAEYSQNDNTYREIAIGTTSWGDAITSGQVWVRQSGDACYPETWIDQGLFIDPLSVGGEVSALAYSSSYSSDTAIVAVVSTGSDVAAAYQDRTWLCILERDTGDWNNITGYPVEIASAGDGVGVSGVYSSLALPSNYSGANATSRQLFVSYNRDPDTAWDDVYRIEDVTLHRLDVDGGLAIDISSIAYNGNLTSGTLLAGATNPTVSGYNVQVWRTTSPWGLPPVWQEASVLPTGPGNARLVWSSDGSLAYCGTGQIPGVALDESAFSASSDDGDSWRQMGLIDTVIKIADVAPAPSGESLFLVSYNVHGPEGVWRSAGDPLGKSWERVLTMDTASDGVILRLSQDYDEDSTLYAAEADGKQLAVSHNRGNTWQWCLYSPGDCGGGTILDLAVASEDIVYAAMTDGYVAKTTYGGERRWTLTDSGLDDINMLSLVDTATIFVGGIKGDIAYSSDSAESFTVIDEVLANGNGDVQVVADAGYGENGTIFAATDLADEGIWRWVIGTSTEWEQIDEIITVLGNGQCVSGLAMGTEGTLYALRLEPASATSGGVLRTLNPLEADVEDIEFDLVNDDLPVNTAFDPNKVYSHTLPYLKLIGSDEWNQLWTADTENQLIYRYIDNLCKVRATLVIPEEGAVLPVDANGYIADLTMCWETLEGATGYGVSIYWDWACTRLEWEGSSDTSSLFATEVANPARLERNTQYYWRVRATEPILSHWCDAWSFVSSLSEDLWTPIADTSGMSPACGASDTPLKPNFCWQIVDGATGYELILAKDSQFSEVVAARTGDDALTINVWKCDVELEYSTVYYWKVRAVSDISYSDWGACLFTTKTAPSTTTGQSSTTTADQPTLSIPSTPSHLIMIAVGAVTALVISLLVFTIRTRSRS